VEFPALILGYSKKVQFRTAEGIYEYRIRGPRLHDGVYIFEPYKMTARMVREAALEERETAMHDYPIINALTSMWNEEAKQWFCHPLNRNQIEKYRGLNFPVPLFLPSEELSILQPIQAWVVRKYGRRVLVFKDLHLRYPAMRLDTLRPLVESIEDVAVMAGRHSHKPTREEMEAFLFAKKSTRPPIERLIGESLSFVGAVLVGYKDMGNGQYQVNYEYKGDPDSITVNQKLTVVDAGICLTDRYGEHYAGHVDYDLGSMVLVKWQGRRRGY
jgi:hypothetical protein